MSGTYTGALMPVLASMECMKMAMEPGVYDHIDELADALYGGMNELMKKNGIPGHVRGIGARFGIYSVSYTHLDVYKRQVYTSTMNFKDLFKSEKCSWMRKN